MNVFFHLEYIHIHQWFQMIRLLCFISFFRHNAKTIVATCNIVAQNSVTRCNYVSLFLIRASTWLFKSTFTALRPFLSSLVRRGKWCILRLICSLFLSLLLSHVMGQNLSRWFVSFSHPPLSHHWIESPCFP